MMKDYDFVAVEQAVKELNSIANIAGEALYVSGFQELQSQFANKLKNLNDVIKEIKENEH